MSAGLDTFDKTVQESNLWLKDVMERLDTRDRHHAYSALRAVLHALRDRIGPESAAHLGAQLPMLLRGLFYAGLGPYGKAQQGASRAGVPRPFAKELPRRRHVSPRSCANSGLPSSRRRRGSGGKARLERCSGRYTAGRRRTKYC